MYSNALLLVTHNLASNAAFSAAAFSASGPRGMGPYLALSSSLKVSERVEHSSSQLQLLILDGKVPRKPDLHPFLFSRVFLDKTGYLHQLKVSQHSEEEDKDIKTFFCPDGLKDEEDNEGRSTRTQKSNSGALQSVTLFCSKISTA